MSETLKIALVQEARGEDVEANVEASVARVREAAAGGAQVVCLQELFASRYLPQRVDVERCRLAEPLPSPTTDRLARLAGELGIVLIVPVFEEARPGVYFNTVVVLDADGACLGKYRKTHIPDGPDYHEKYYFTPGNLGYPVWDTAFGRLAVGICWDEWFPEVARIFALQGADVIFYPSAIGTEPDRPGYSSHEAWQTVLRSHAIANGVFVAAINRVGREDGMSFYGKSFVADPFGEIVAEAPKDAEAVVHADLDRGRIRELRDLLHFLRDRRVDTYGPLLSKIIE